MNTKKVLVVLIALLTLSMCIRVFSAGTLTPKKVKVSLQSVENYKGQIYAKVTKEITGKPLKNVPIVMKVSGDKNYAKYSNYKGLILFTATNLKLDNYYGKVYVLKYSTYVQSNVAKVSFKKADGLLKVKSPGINKKTKYGFVGTQLICNNGDPLSGRKIFLKIQGKTYTGYSNKNGVVVFRVSITKETTVSAIFLGDSTYLSQKKNIKLIWNYN